MKVKVSETNMPKWGNVTVKFDVPEKLEALQEMSKNIFWTWTSEATNLFKDIDADFFCIQETKMQEEQIDITINSILKGYHQYWNSAEKKGYSGVAIFSKTKPLSVAYDMGIAHHDKEGRIICAEYKDFYLVNVYTPNSKRELERLSYRMEWEDDFRAYLKNLEKTKPVIVCGDLNVAHQEIDLKNPKTNRRNAGFKFNKNVRHN